MKYDADYFIKKFEAIPNSKWVKGYYRKGSKCCAIGHCRAIGGDTVEMAFRNIISYPTNINDGYSPAYKQKTPKARILAALKDAKEAGR